MVGGEAKASDDAIKKQVASLYLLQLRKGYFTADEIQAATGLDSSECDVRLRELEQLRLVAKLGLRDEDPNRFALTPDGRRRIVVILTGGVYDVIHLGHVAALSEAKSLGDVLVVVVATDVTVENFKGRKPVFPEEDRRALVESLRFVDRAILGYEDVGMGYEQVMVEVNPDIIAIGYDQDVLERTVREIAERRRFKIRIVRLSRFDREAYLSSSAVRQKLSETWK